MSTPDISLPEGMRAAGSRDWRRLGAITAEAFAEDPVNLWIFGNAAPLVDVFGVLAKDVYLRRGFCHLSGDSNGDWGATMWSHSSASREMGFLATLGLVTSVMRKGTRGAAKRGLAAAETMAREHPTAPHLYLFTIGTRKAARGKGLGKALMARVRADEAVRAGAGRSCAGGDVAGAAGVGRGLSAPAKLNNCTRCKNAARCTSCLLRNLIGVFAIRRLRARSGSIVIRGIHERGQTRR
jgi:ribosomal protein S18 acetylase RimI-like enzyme